MSFTDPSVHPAGSTDPVPAHDPGSIPITIGHYVPPAAWTNPQTDPCPVVADKNGR